MRKVIELSIINDIILFPSCSVSGDLRDVLTFS